MASALGVKVIATAGSDDKCVVCEQLGAVKAINYHKQDFVAEFLVSVSLLDVFHSLVGKLEQLCLLCAPHIHIHEILHEVGTMIQS